MLVDSPQIVLVYSWVIDGFTGATKIHSPYTMLIGIALTDMSVPYSGNHCVYAFSHVLLQEHYKQQAHMNCADMSSPLPSSSKPPLEEPEQVQCDEKWYSVMKCTLK